MSTMLWTVGFDEHFRGKVDVSDCCSPLTSPKATDRQVGFFLEVAGSRLGNGSPSPGMPAPTRGRKQGN
jgi:hypothetical protein